MTGGWVLRRAAEPRECDNCWCSIPRDDIYFLTMAGEKFCAQCPPDEEIECPL